MAETAGPTGPPPSRPFLELRPLLRAPGLASDARKLILAGAGLLALYAGWWALDAPFAPPMSVDPERPAAAFVRALDAPIRDPTAAFDRVLEPFQTVVAPFAALFRWRTTPYDWTRSALKALWAAVAWGIFGGAIARVAVVQAAVDRRVGLGSALRFALARAGSLIGAPLTPMLAVALLAGGCALFGLACRLPGGVGGVVAAAFGFVPPLLGLVMALILVGLALGWPLMHATIAAENEDAPDALSRSYSYVNQRLARYAAHAAAALAIGAVGLLAAAAFGRVVLALADWGVSLGAPGLDPRGVWTLNGRLFWPRAVGLAVLAWAYSYFWSASSILYLILRRDVDGTAWHDVYLPEHDADTFAGDLGPAKGPAAVTEEAPAPTATSAP